MTSISPGLIEECTSTTWICFSNPILSRAPRERFSRSLVSLHVAQKIGSEKDYLADRITPAKTHRSVFCKTRDKCFRQCAWNFANLIVMKLQVIRSLTSHLQFERFKWNHYVYIFACVRNRIRFYYSLNFIGWNLTENKMKENVSLELPL